MDIDLELESDKIRDFLLGKLDGIKLKNVELAESLQLRRGIASKCLEDAAKERTHKGVALGPIWKRITNGKYIVGVPVMTDETLQLNEMNILLNWDSSLSLTYTTHLISDSDNMNWSRQIRQSGQIVIILRIPLFVEQLNYTIRGAINFQQKRKKFTLNLPSIIQLSCRDVTDNSILTQMNRVIDGNFEDLLACTASSKKQNFVIASTFTNAKVPLDRAFGIDCSFTKVDTKSMSTNFYMADRICHSIDGCILEHDGDGSIVTIYYRDSENLLALIHYIYQKIDGIVIVPKPLYQPDLDLPDLVILAKKNLEKEIECLENGQNLGEVHNKISELERATDVVIARIKEKLNTNDL